MLHPKILTRRGRFDLRLDLDLIELRDFKAAIVSTYVPKAGGKIKLWVFSPSEGGLQSKDVLSTVASMRSPPRMLPMERRLPTPREIFSYLNEYIIGQSQAKRALAIAAYNHLKRCGLPKTKRKLIKKANLLLMGPTGCGKTYLAQKLAEFLQVPFCITDATDYTQAGYHGKDVEVMVAELLHKAHHSLEEAQRGIIFIDEIDKIASRSQGVQMTGFRDIGGEGVQQALLKLLEGREVLVPTNLTQQWTKQELIQLDTSDILFVAAGTFGNLKQASTRVPPGFGNQSPIRGKSIEIKELQEYGLLPEFLGRFPNRVQLDPLTEDQLVEILIEPPDSLIREYQALLELDGVHLQFEDEALRSLARHALQKHIGARGLRALLEEVCHDIMFEAPELKGQTVFITPALIEKRLQTVC